MLLNNRCILLIISKRLFVSLAKLYEATVIFRSHYKNPRPSVELNSDMTFKILFNFGL
jgi:hypothetical protein